MTLYDNEDEKYIARWTLSHGVNHLIVTRGEKGVTCYSGADTDSMIENTIPAEKVKSANKVGCGDIFGAAAFYHFLSTGNMQEAIKFANRAAGLATTFTDIGQLHSMREKLVYTND
jgi:sugar/nucleoside kinase (ribokinase family)